MHQITTFLFSQQIELNLTTYGFLFSAVSLLFLAYTNRFLATGQLIRSLWTTIKANKSKKILGQIKNLKKRMELIRWTQIFGALCLIFATVSSLFICFNISDYAYFSFVLSLIWMLISLTLLLTEIFISTFALNIELNELRQFGEEHIHSTEEKEEK